jgi:hypothetical protein
VIKGDAVTDYVTGALVVSSKQEVIESVKVLPTSLSERLIFIGQVAGQISRWPSEDMPAVWIPVWVLYRTSRKKWATHFCRQNVAENLEPIVGKGYSAKELRAWKEALWVMRKRTRPPELPALAKLWMNYTEAAKNI